jgi:hypothetical protein
MRHDYRETWVEYHSDYWETLVSNGWITMYVEDMKGVQMARMIRDFYGSMYRVI